MFLLGVKRLRRWARGAVSIAIAAAILFLPSYNNREGEFGQAEARIGREGIADPGTVLDMISCSSQSSLIWCKR